jgi:hypothetical protein
MGTTIKLIDTAIDLAFIASVLTIPWACISIVFLVLSTSEFYMVANTLHASVKKSK